MGRASFQQKKRDSVGPSKPRDGGSAGKSLGVTRFDETENMQKGRYDREAKRDTGERIYRNPR